MHSLPSPATKPVSEANQSLSCLPRKSHLHRSETLEQYETKRVAKEKPTFTSH
jgi:hypothetical protein